MTVAEVIEVLKNFPQDMEIVTDTQVSKKLTPACFLIKKVTETNEEYYDLIDDVLHLSKSIIKYRSMKSNIDYIDNKELENLKKQADEINEQLVNIPKEIVKECVVISAFYLKPK